MSTVQQLKDALTGGPKKYIMSVFPIGMTAVRPFNGYTTYILPASREPGEVTVCEVGNAFQRSYVGDGNWADVPVFADDIARDLLNEFASGMVGQDSGYGPGIWLQNRPEPDPRLKEEAMARQTQYFNYLVQQADSLFAAGKANQITGLHRAAARWLGKNDVPWVEETRRRETKECVACFSKIDARATVCPVCTTRQPGKKVE